MQVKVRGAYNYDADEVSRETAYYDDTPSKTDQSFAEEVDINTIVKRFGLTGEMPQQVAMPTYADFREAVTDYHTALLMLRQADDAFMSLPAELRARFHNDAGELVTFLEDPSNRPEAERLGLVRGAPGDPVPRAGTGAGAPDSGSGGLPPAAKE